MRKLYKWISSTFKRLSPTQCIALAFIGMIAVGTLLLSLPVSSRDHRSCGMLTALFTATSATCVTGLSVVDTYTQWSSLGQIFILAMIQVGGLGFMAMASIFFFMLRRKISLRKRLLIAQALSLSEINGVVRMQRHVLLGTLLFEGTGALILTIRFLFSMPFPQALWWGIFHAISAFCNAGFDIMGSVNPGTSVALFATDPVVNLVLMTLIIMGGLGFFVWEDVLRYRSRKRLSVYTRLVFGCTAFLVIGGAILFCILEWNNPRTIGDLQPLQKILVGTFQSVTTRTAGFASVDQGALTESSQAVTTLLMLIGGSSGSTAGGIKTVTIAVLILAAVATYRGQNHLTVMHHTVNQEQVNNAMAITVLIAIITLAGGTFVAVSNRLPFMAAIYETASAIGTVGLSTGITATLNSPTLVLLILLMFFGRVGIMTISLGFLLSNRAEDRYHYAETKLLIG